MNPLFAVRDLLRAQGVATAGQIAGSLDLPEGVVENALSHWRRRGLVQSETVSGGVGCGFGSQSLCGSCNGCDLAAHAHPKIAAYRWLGPH